MTLTKLTHLSTGLQMEGLHYLWPDASEAMVIYKDFTYAPPKAVEREYMLRECRTFLNWKGVLEMYFRFEALVGAIELITAVNTYSLDRRLETNFKFWGGSKHFRAKLVELKVSTPSEYTRLSMILEVASIGPKSLAIDFETQHLRISRSAILSV